MEKEKEENTQRIEVLIYLKSNPKNSRTNPGFWHDPFDSNGVLDQYPNYRVWKWKVSDQNRRSTNLEMKILAVQFLNANVLSECPCFPSDAFFLPNNSLCNRSIPNCVQLQVVIDHWSFMNREELWIQLISNFVGRVVRLLCQSSRTTPS